MQVLNFETFVLKAFEPFHAILIQCYDAVLRRSAATLDLLRNLLSHKIFLDSHENWSICSSALCRYLIPTTWERHVLLKNLKDKPGLNLLLNMIAASFQFLFNFRSVQTSAGPHQVAFCRWLCLCDGLRGLRRHWAHVAGQTLLKLRHFVVSSTVNWSTQ